jgi:ATP adenylyltransferase
MKKKILYAPWREVYLETTNGEDNDKSSSAEDKPKPCPFCKIFSDNCDEENFVVYRGKKSAIVMNLYPYNAGHLMVIPFDHVPEFLDLPEEVDTEINKLIKKSVMVVRTVCNPDGFNIGLNLGRAGGGGIPEHMHWQIVPRWYGDTNFMTTISDTRLISIEMKKLFKKLRDEIKKIT